jgi:hypothetical protein
MLKGEVLGSSRFIMVYKRENNINSSNNSKGSSSKSSKSNSKQ